MIDSRSSVPAARRGVVSVAVLSAWGSLTFVLGVILWSARRGFDLLDGGYYYLTYTDPEDVRDTHTSFHLVGGLVLRLVGGNIIAFRIVTELLVALSAGYLGWVVTRELRRRKAFAAATPSFLITFPLWAIAGLLNFTSAPTALTYNSLNAGAVFVSLGLLIQGLSILAADPASIGGFSALAAAYGVAGFDLFIKPTTSLSLLVLFVLVALVTPEVERRTKTRLIGVAVLAGLVSLPAFRFVVGSWSAVAARLHTFSSILQNTAFLREMLVRAGDDLMTLGQFVVGDLWPAALALAVLLLVARLRPPTERASRWPTALASLLAAGWLIFRFVRNQQWHADLMYFADGNVVRLLLDTLILASGVRLVAAPPPEASSASYLHFWLVGGLLFLAPFLGAFGTSNLLYLNAAYQAPCFVAVALALTACTRMAWLPLGLVLLLTPALAAQYYDGKVTHPYSLPEHLSVQDTPVVIGEPGTELLVDRGNATFIRNVRTALAGAGFHPGDDLFAFFNMPGLVYAVGGRSPTVPWYFGKIYAGDHSEEAILRATDPLRLKRAYLITQDDLTRFAGHFHAGGIPFPEGYECVAWLVNPNTALPVKIWRPKG